MKTEIRTAIIMAMIVIVGIGGASAYFSSLEEPKVSDAKLSTNDQPVAKPTSVSSIDKSHFKKAPELVGIAGYINTTPEELKAVMQNKVVLYDFWTYSCINCQRTIPYLNAWNDKYTDQELLIIGIHSPEFEFEKDMSNVERAVKQYGIKYPVVLDNDHQTWNTFENRYWPRKYIADDEGYIRYDHIGEGGYDETEKVIQDLLKERASHLGLKVVEAQPLVELKEFEHTSLRTPELYFGYNFTPGRNQLGNSEGFIPGNDVEYVIPEKLQLHNYY
ncbi:MAG: redoxin domain-containing protein, partial [Nitrosopumilaceae archaeon]